MSHRWVASLARRATVSVLAAGLVSLLLPGPSSAVTPTVLVVNPSANPLLTSESLKLTFVVTPATAGLVTVTISNGTNSPPVVIDPVTGSGSWTVSGLPVGRLNVTSRFRATSETYLDSSTIIGLDVLDTYPQSTTVQLTASSNPSYVGHASTLSARVIGPGGAPVVPGGSVAFELDGTGIAFASAPLTDDVASVSAAAVPVGSHLVFARYIDGNGASITVGWPLTLIVISDTTVSVTGVGVAPSTFYPVKDAYLDTLAIRGTLGEQASVAISIYSAATGKKVRAFSLTPRVGAYQVAWNGRTSSGTLLATGKYKVTQVLRDMVGNRKTVTSYATLSQKLMYWYTKSQTRPGQPFNGGAAQGDAFERPSRFVNGVNLDGGTDVSLAWVGYAFLLPTATTYSTVTCGVLGVSDAGRGGATIHLRNWATDDFDGAVQTRSGYGWTYTSVPGKGHVSGGRQTHCFVNVYSWDDGQFDTAQVKLTYRFGILK